MKNNKMNQYYTNVIILEDSLKGGFGGGQKGTLEVIDALINDFNIIVGDTTDLSGFAKQIKKRNLKQLFLKSTKRLSKGKTASFSMDWKEYIIYPIHLVKNITTLTNYLSKSDLSNQNTLIYTSHKKRLVESWILKILKGYQYIYHIRTFDSKHHPLFFVMKHLMKKAYMNIAVSNSIAANIHMKDIHVIPNPLHIDIETKHREPGNPFIVAVFATLLGWKGIDVFMHSHTHLKNQKNIYFEVYGDGPIRDKLKKLESDHVRLMGYTTNVPDIMKRRISLVCVPSIKPESFGRISLEAFAFGIPAIASNLGGQPEIIDDQINGFLIEPGCPEKIADSIDKLFENSEVYMDFSRNALRKAHEFSYEIFSGKIHSLFSA